jgi:hypothetical protein
MTAQGLAGGENMALAPEINKTSLKRPGQADEVSLTWARSVL